MNFTTDGEFPPYWAKELGDIINSENGNQAKVEIIDTSWGHLACYKEAEKIGEHIKEFLREIES